MALTYLEAARVIGAQGEWEGATGLFVAVEVMDVREVFGRTDYLIRPVAGAGQVWVAAYSVIFPPEGGK